MSITFIKSRAVAAALSAAVIASVAAPTAAEAGGRTRTAVGVGLAAGALGLALGANAANARERDEYYDDREVVYRPAPRCYLERREYEDRYGDIHVRSVRVCR